MGRQYGDVVVTRDVIDGKPWIAVPQYVVERLRPQSETPELPDGWSDVPV